MSRVCILIANFNGWRDTLECLESVFHVAHADFQVVVIDNASGDGSLERIRGWADGDVEAPSTGAALANRPVPTPVPKPLAHRSVEAGALRSSTAAAIAAFSTTPLLLIANESNRGYAAGVNVGLSYALARTEFSHIWILNNDTVVEADALESMLEALETSDGETRVGIVGSKLLFYDEPRRLQAVGGRLNRLFASTRHIGGLETDRGQFDSRPPRCDYLVGASMLVTADCARDVGLLSEDYFLFWEDVDWAVRARRKGWACRVCASSRVFHKGGASAESGRSAAEKSVFADYHSLRGRLLFTRKFYPFFLPFVYCGFLAVFANRLRRGQFALLPNLKVLFGGKGPPPPSRSKETD